MTQADGDWILKFGSRAQRRNGLRQLKAQKRGGNPEAAEMLAEVLQRKRGAA
ncbi:hypothetical protein [Aromatoleum anaerobium]|uniref:Uncharacterized protein n=1 Tax=Aromatoleum anaerobium TaxID=182180 RepID=A0ABX1PRE4_9RHOO|nr:hypothetical protein [Aromatoleum anaerobium]MCK0506330.1 hypothetical protein [Aromatoleum anaerobium]